MITVFHAFLGFLYLFFWMMAFGLAKDRARSDKGYVYSTLFSVGLISVMIFFTLVLMRMFFWTGPIEALLAVGEFLVDLLANVWGALGFIGFILSASLGAHFGVVQYNRYDKIK